MLCSVAHRFSSSDWQFLPFHSEHKEDLSCKHIHTLEVKNLKSNAKIRNKFIKIFRNDYYFHKVIFFNQAPSASEKDDSFIPFQDSSHLRKIKIFNDLWGLICLAKTVLHAYEACHYRDTVGAKEQSSQLFPDLYIKRFHMSSCRAFPKSKF